MEVHNIAYNRNEYDESAREVFYLTLKSMDDFTLEDVLGYEA